MPGLIAVLEWGTSGLICDCSGPVLVGQPLAFLVDAKKLESQE
jgi:hypothetical protein